MNEHLESVACNLCGDPHPRFVYQRPDTKYPTGEVFSVVECRLCGLGFVNPRPTYAAMSRYYPADFYDYFDDLPQYHARRYQVEASYLAPLPRAASPPRLLDIGCANGDFPRFMRAQGWRVEGVEVSQNSKAITDFPVYKVPFPDIPVDAPSYDAITAWAVLEHVHDPMAYFVKAGQLLKGGGHFVFHVTNFDSLSSRSLFLEDLPRHLYFFTEATVRQYLQKSGLELMRADYDNRIYEMRPTNWLYYYWRRLRGKALTFEDLPESRSRFFSRCGLSGDRAANVRYVRYLLLSHPLALVDRILVPVVERVQMLRRRYGVVTFVARKP